jgi:hypothetical protein
MQRMGSAKTIVRRGAGGGKGSTKTMAVQPGRK